MQKLKLSYSPYRAQFSAARHEEMKEAKKEAKKMVSFVIKQSWIVVGLLIVAGTLGFFQVITYNKLATKGYGLKRLQVARQSLETQSEITNQYLADAKSMGNLVVNPSISNMRSPNQVQYVMGNSTELAKAY